jgi:hypothetical protein
VVTDGVDREVEPRGDLLDGATFDKHRRERNAALDNLVLPYAISRHILIRLPSDLFVNEEDPLTGSILVARDDGTAVQYVTGLTPAATSVHSDGDRWYLGALLGQPVRWMPAP